jgi:negative regulator of flagellin synthesis FlgM
MKVNPATTQAVQNNDVSGTSGAKRAEKAGAASASSKVSAKTVDSSSTKAEISAKAKEFAKAKEAATSAPDVREDRIAELKKRIAAGNYQVNAEAIANKMVDEHVSSGIG